MPLTDTTPEAERVLSEIYRAMPSPRKWLIVGEAYRTARLFHAAGVHRKNPNATPRDILEDWFKSVLGCSLVPNVGDALVDLSQISFQGVREIIRVFVRLGIPYALGGSMASSILGVPRYTQDADITVEPFADKLDDVLQGFGPEYYVSRQAAEEAHRRHSSFNIINTMTGFKADIFLCKPEGFEQSAMSRRTSETLPDAPDEPIIIHSAEDMILFKLRWFRLGNETAQQQWRDVQGIRHSQAGKLDEAYLDRWAADLGVADLLARARQESNP